MNLDLARGFVLFDAAKIRPFFEMRKRLHKKSLLSDKIRVKYYGFAIFGRQIRSINSKDTTLIVHLEHHLLEDSIGLFLAD